MLFLSSVQQGNYSIQSFCANFGSDLRCFATTAGEGHVARLLVATVGLGSHAPQKKSRKLRHIFRKHFRACGRRLSALQVEVFFRANVDAYRLLFLFFWPGRRLNV